MKYILALDQGTTSSRAILFNEHGIAVSKSQNEFTQIYPAPGSVEHDPLEILYSQMRAAAEAVNASGADPKEIAAVGITNQRETTVVWERDTGRPVYNAIVWQCRRTAPECEELARRGLSDYITEKTGLLIDAYFSATKIKWILDHVPGARERAYRGELLFGTVDTWLIWNLTGGKSHVTDYTNAARTMLFDIGSLTWDERLCRELDIPVCMLPEVLSSSASFGTVADGLPGLESLAGVPILGVAGDQQAALFGQACFEAGDTKCTYGTGCFLVMNIGNKPILSKNRLLTTIAWGVDGKVEYALEGSIFNAGSVIKWLRDDLRIINTASEVNELAESVPDAGGMYFVPAFTGLGAPRWDMYARGAMVGMTRGTGRAEIARSVVESIAYQVKDLIDAMQEDASCRVRELRVDGGASVSNVMMQFQADMLACRVNRPQNVETTALGAAFLAGLEAGVWKSKNQIAELWKSERLFVNSMPDAERNERYRQWQRAVERSLDWVEH